MKQTKEDDGEGLPGVGAAGEIGEGWGNAWLHGGQGGGDQGEDEAVEDHVSILPADS